MSLSSLRSNLRYYNSQVTYWRGSADEYSKQMGTYQGELRGQHRAGHRQL